MARIKQGFLGNASGKLGNVVFSKWRNLETARQYQPDVHDANTHAQQKQRSRMVSLLQFLKPLNKTFIRFFNSSISKGSTPWAKAIQANMQAVNDEGCIIPENFTLGNPKYPPFEITDVTYNPFIDLCSVDYKPTDLSGWNDPYPYIMTSVLGQYKSKSGLPEFDIRYPACYLPPGHFFCSYYDENFEHVFDNWWDGFWLWCMYFDTYDLERTINPNHALTEPIYSRPTSLIEGFNTDITVNPVPVEAFTWEYVQREKKWYLVFKIDIKKTQLVNPKDYTIIFWSVSLQNSEHKQHNAIEWNLSEPIKEFELGEEGFNGSIIGLYALYTNKGEQAGCFNRFYINRGSDGREYPYYEQLFECNYGHPVSFILKGNQCGFCGNLDEMFSDFIQLYEQGIIHDPNQPK
jgi:hypothetical protein